MGLRRYRIGFLAAVVFALMSVVPATNVGATALGVIPGVLPSGTSVIVLQGNGFGPTEVVRVTGFLNDGRTAIYPDIRADGAGGFISPQNTVDGVVRLVAVGQSTGLTADTIIGIPNFPPGALPGVFRPSYYGGGYPYAGYGGYGGFPYGFVRP